MAKPPMPEPTPSPPQIHRLTAVTARIRDLLLEITVRRFWVRARLVAGGPTRSGHFYGELLAGNRDICALCSEG